MYDTTRMLTMTRLVGISECHDVIGLERKLAERLPHIECLA